MVTVHAVPQFQNIALFPLFHTTEFEPLFHVFDIVDHVQFQSSIMLLFVLLLSHVKNHDAYDQKINNILNMLIYQ